MASHAREGHKADGGRCAHDCVAPTAPVDASEQNPLDFALAFMRDASKPDALRVSVAKAALPYMHERRAPDAAEREDAPPKLPPPFDLPDPYNSLSVAWREAIGRAAGASTTPSREPAPAVALLVPGTAQHERSEVVRCRPGTVADTVVGTVPDQQCIARTRCTASGTRATDDAPAQPAETEDRTRALEQRAVVAEGRLREAEFRARDMESRALAAEALIARGR